MTVATPSSGPARRRQHRRSLGPLAVVAVLTAGLLACSTRPRPGTTTTTTRPVTTVGSSTTVAPTTTRPTTPGGSAVTPPPPNAGFDYQIGGAYPPIAGVRIVTRAHEARSPVPGLYNVCYINGFQAQTADEGWWLGSHRDLVLHDGTRPVKDPDWNELFLDTSTATKRAGLAEIVGGWITGCKTSGFQAVEIDNLDSYLRTGGRLRVEHNIAFLRLLADRAHGLGLAIGQKNSPDLSTRRAELGTDFAVAEECNRYDECDAYTRGYGDNVLLVEYRRADFTKGCSRWPQLSIVLRDEAVRTRTTANDIC